MSLSYYALGVVWSVRDLQCAKAVLTDVLHFPVSSEGPDFCELDNGSTHIRLERSAHDQRITLQLLADDVQAAGQHLVDQAGLSLLRPLRWVSTARQELVLRHGDWLQLVLARNFDEDELGLVPDLPTSLAWDVEAGDALKTLLTRVPVSFREDARRRATARAEELCLARGEVEVDTYSALRGLVLVTPRFQHPSIVEIMRELGLDPSRWSPELDVDQEELS